jgi:hypothetical protein
MQYKPIWNYHVENAIFGKDLNLGVIGSIFHAFIHMCIYSSFHNMGHWIEHYIRFRAIQIEFYVANLGYAYAPSCGHTTLAQSMNIGQICGQSTTLISTLKVHQLCASINRDHTNEIYKYLKNS